MAVPASAEAGSTTPAPPAFVELYDAHAKFVWRAVQRLGVPADATEDVVQEIFLVVHRRLPEFEQRSSTRTWIYGIAIRVARHHRRTVTRRCLAPSSGREDLDTHVIAEDPGRGPDVVLEKTEAARLVQALLDEIDDDLREVFVLAELEEMKLSEIADVLGMNSNTVASRLRAARQAFERALARAHARDQWRMR